MTREQAIREAAAYGLTAEVIDLMNNGVSPEDALKEWDI